MIDVCECVVVCVKLFEGWVVVGYVLVVFSIWDPLGTLTSERLHLF